MKLKNIKKKLKNLSIIALMGTMLAPTLASTPALAKDASHQGMSYLQVKLSPSTHHIESTINGGETGDNWGGSDVIKTPEYKATGVLFAKSSYNANGGTKAKEGPTDFGQTLNSGNGSLFSDSGFADTWEEKMKNLKFDQGRGTGQTENLTMSFPGWGGADRAWDVSSGGKGKDRNDDKNIKYRDINSDVAVDSAQAVSNTLIPEFNKALDEFYSKIENGEAELSDAGMANMVWLVANGYFPDPSSPKLTYDSATGKISGKFKKGEFKSSQGKVKAGGTVTTVTSPKKDGTDFTTGDQKYVYRVWKGYDKDPNNKYDNLFISWSDVALSATAYTVRDSGVETSDNTTVVGDQVNSFVYSMISGALGALGVKKADDLVFGKEGNLFRNGTWQIYAALMAPFVVMGIMVLGLVIFDAWRKANMRYLTTGAVTSIQSSVARVFNAMVMMLAAPMIVIGLIALDGALVGVASGLNTSLAKMAGYAANTGAIAWAMRGISGIILAILLAFVNVKYTWRYIARSITFGIYYMTSPLMFAIDSLKGDGGLFQYGQMTGEVWKNLIGTIFQRTFDAFGLVIALNLGKIIFGDGMLISILGYFAIEAITNALMSTFGVTPTTIKGMAEAGQNMFKRTSGAIATGIVAKAGAVGLAGAVGYQQKRKENKLGQDKTKTGSAFNDESSSNKKVGEMKDNAAFKSGKNSGYGSNLTDSEQGNVENENIGYTDSISDFDSLQTPVGSVQGFDSDGQKENIFDNIEGNNDNSTSNIGKVGGIGSQLKAGLASATKETLNPKSWIGAGLMGLSQLTPGHVDDFLGGALLANNAERIINTGRTDEHGNPISQVSRGALGALTGTAMARMMGIRKPLEIDTWEASQERLQQQLMREKSKAPVSTNSLLGETPLKISGENSAFTSTALNHKNLSKDDKEGYKALTELVSNPKMVGLADSNGVVTRSGLVDRAIDPLSGQLDKNVENALGFMDRQGFSAAVIKEGQEAHFKKAYRKLDESSMSDAVQNVVSQAGENMDNGSTRRDSGTGIQISKDTSGNVSSYVPNNFGFKDGIAMTNRDMVSQRSEFLSKSDGMSTDKIKEALSANTPEQWNSLDLSDNKVTEKFEDNQADMVNANNYDLPASEIAKAGGEPID